MHTSIPLPFRIRPTGDTPMSHHVVMALGLLYILGATNFGHSAAAQTANQKENKIMNEVSGAFEVKITPAETDDAQLGMMLLDKSYQGDLQATGTGRMLTGMTAVKGSAGYVAIERVEGTLKGAKGTFLIQHSGISTADEKTLLIQVIPNSGTDALKGIEGTMDINVEEGKHVYHFKYSLPST